MCDPQITIEETNDPVACERNRLQRERAERNWKWLEGHWPDLLPRAFGRFLAVAEQEAYVADTVDEALAWIRTRHPDDTGRIVEYVAPPTGPRSYAGGPC